MTRATESDDPLAPVLQRAFAPLGRTAFGAAVGVTAGLAVFLLTAFHVVVRPVDALAIGLLGQYFYGYEVTWSGAFVGLLWGVASGFAAGWLVAFLRNASLWAWVTYVRTRGSLEQDRDFLDNLR